MSEDGGARTRRSSGATGIAIGGVQWTTLIDYPGKVAATVFTIGCSFRCPFCHNPELVDPVRYAPEQDELALYERLRDRTGFLDGVVITGGEPTLQPALVPFVERIKELGLLVKLDTNGARPDVLSAILAADLVDYVAMDVKAPLHAYERLTGVACDVGWIEESIEHIRSAAPDYEFRTTVAPTLQREDILRIADHLAGAKRFFLQAFRVPESGLLDPTWGGKTALPKAELEGLWAELRPRFLDGGVRG